VQICCMLCSSKDLSQIDFKNILIKTDGFDILNSNIHGITFEKSVLEGVEFARAIESDIAPILKRANYLVAHNSDFDTNILKSELFRYHQLDTLAHFENMHVVCSMKATKQLVKAKSSNNRLKMPNLKELYEFATKKEMTNHHDASFDVINLHEAIKILLETNALAKSEFFPLLRTFV
jgi:DNA polymerase III subunit alpha